MDSDTDFTPSPKQGKNKKAMSNSPSRPMSGRITMGTLSTIDRLMMSMGTQKDGAPSSTRLQPQLMSSSLGLTPVLGSAGDARTCLPITSLEERDMMKAQDMMKRIDRVEERAQQGHETNWQMLNHKPNAIKSG